MHILTVLSAIGKVESAAEELYRWLSEALSHDREASSLFFRMSLQERSHANVVSYAKRLAGRNPDEFADVTLDLGTVTTLIDEVIQFRQFHRSPTVEEAVHFAIQIENNAGERVHRSLVINSNPELEHIINSLAKADEEHTRGLRALANQRGFAVS